MSEIRWRRGTPSRSGPSRPTSCSAWLAPTYAVPSQQVLHMEMVEQVTAGSECASVRRGRGVLARPGRAGHQPARPGSASSGRPLDLRTRLLVVQADGRRVGLMADEAREFITIPDDAIRPPHDAIGGLSGNYLDGVATLGDRIVLMLNIREVVERAPTAAGLIRLGECSVFKENDDGSQRRKRYTARAHRSPRTVARRGEPHHRGGVADRADDRPGVGGRRSAGAVARQRAQRPQPDDRVAQGDGDAGGVGHRRRPTAWCRRSTRSPPRSSRSRGTRRASPASSSRRPRRFRRATRRSRRSRHRAGDGHRGAAGHDVDDRDDRLGEVDDRRHRRADLVGQRNRRGGRGDDAARSRASRRTPTTWPPPPKRRRPRSTRPRRRSRKSPRRSTASPRRSSRTAPSTEELARSVQSVAQSGQRISEAATARRDQRDRTRTCQSVGCGAGEGGRRDYPPRQPGSRRRAAPACSARSRASRACGSRWPNRPR